jgi:cyanophycin synthetase
MDFGRIGVLRGASVWSRQPVLEVELDPRGLGPNPGLAGRLRPWLPGLDARQVEGEVGLAHALGHATLDLQRRAGSPVRFVTVKAGEPVRVVVEYEEEALGRAALESARRLCLAALRGEPCAVEGEREKLRDLGHEVRLGPSTAAIVAAARRRGIPVRRLNAGSLVQLGHGARLRRICTAETDATSALGEGVAQDKELTRSLLRAVGVPVPQGRPVTDAEDAWAAALELETAVVVKPRHGNHGRGVTTNLTTREQVLRAYAAARAEGDEVVVERFVPGQDYRLLVVGDRMVAAALREPAQVVGDGKLTIAELVGLVNKDPRRSDGHATVLSLIKLDAIALAVLAEQGYTPDSIPPAGKKVLIRRNANLSTGGTATDVTDRVHPDLASRAADAARAVGLDIAGVDVVALDVALPPEEQAGAVVEVNAGPGLRMHLEPSAGQPRPVGEAVVDMLFGEGQTGRIPLAAVTGGGGRTASRLLAHLLERPGGAVGLACADGLYVGGRRIDPRDGAGPRGARALLLNPGVTAAVLETAAAGVLREGLGFDECAVAVVTAVGRGDALGEPGRVERVVVEAVAPEGAAVLAGDDLAARLAGHCPGGVIFFARDEGRPAIVPGE